MAKNGLTTSFDESKCYRDVQLSMAAEETPTTPLDSPRPSLSDLAFQLKSRSLPGSD